MTNITAHALHALHARHAKPAETVPQWAKMRGYDAPTLTNPLANFVRTEATRLANIPPAAFTDVDAEFYMNFVRACRAALADRFTRESTRWHIKIALAELDEDGE